MDHVKCMRAQAKQFNETGEIGPIVVLAGMNLVHEVERLRERNKELEHELAMEKEKREWVRA